MNPKKGRKNTKDQVRREEEGIKGKEEEKTPVLLVKIEGLRIGGLKEGDLMIDIHGSTGPGISILKIGIREIEDRGKDIQKVINHMRRSQESTGGAGIESLVKIEMKEGRVEIKMREGLVRIGEVNINVINIH